MAETSIAITDADLTNPTHAAAIVDLIDVLATWPENGLPLPEDVRPTLISKLIEYNRCHDSLHILLAWEEETAVGLAVCFKGFSTFRGAPLLNIHDFVVRDGFRGRGIFLCSSIKCSAVSGKAICQSWSNQLASFVSSSPRTSTPTSRFESNALLVQRFVSP